MTEESFLYLPLKVLEKEFRLNNGRALPKITCEYKLDAEIGISQIEGFENIYNAVDVALEVGYRSFDCSPQNMGEENLGNALEELLPKYNLQRNDIIITSKILTRDYGMDSTSEAFWRSCEHLKTNYIDLFLMQWPGGHNLDAELEENRHLREETWKEIVQLSSRGVIKSPGVSHFTCTHLDSIWRCSGKIPVINQTEFHPKYPQVELFEYCNDNNILLQACSFKETFHPLLLNDDTVKRVAKTLSKTPTQILLKWIINRNVGVIPQSQSPKKIRQNFQLFDFPLEKPEMDMITSIQAREKYLRNPICVI